VLDDLVRELAALHFGGAVHQAGEVVGDALAGDGLVHAGDDRVGGFGPAHVAQHHLAREDHRARIDLVEVGVLRRGAVGRSEHAVAGDFIDTDLTRSPQAKVCEKVPPLLQDHRESID
jgi:hypothetical protein